MSMAKNDVKNRMNQILEEMENEITINSSSLQASNIVKDMNLIKKVIFIMTGEKFDN